MLPNQYEDERFCEHCEKETPHTCYDSGHERDSSNDYQKCQVCGWWLLGMFTHYLPPSD